VGVAIFFLLLLLVAGFIVYPLLPGRGPTQPAPAVSEGDIEQAVRDLRQARAESSLSCPACGQAYRAGDRFCVRCGGTLPQADSSGLACPACGSPLHEQDQFCAKCGHRMAAEEAV